MTERPETLEVRIKEICHTGDDPDWLRRLAAASDIEGERMKQEYGYAASLVLTRTLTPPAGGLGYGSTLETILLLSEPVSSSD